jgi:hypothetical protein
MPDVAPSSVGLAHIAGELETTHIVVLVAAAIVANAVLLAPRLFGLFAKGPLRRALEKAAGPGARIGPIVLPLRGSLSVEGVELPGLADLSHIVAEVDLLGLRRDPVAIPRIVLTRAPVVDAPGEARGEGSRHLDGPPNPAPTAGEPASPRLRDHEGASDRRRYEVGTLVIRSGVSDEAEPDGPGRPDEGPATTLEGPGSPLDLDGLVRHLVRELRGNPHDPTSAPGAEAGPL